LVITDGAPNSSSTVTKAIQNISNELPYDSALSITFVQIGRDKYATRFLKQLDDQLECKFDIVDTLTSEEMQGMDFDKMIQKSIQD